MHLFHKWKLVGKDVGSAMQWTIFIGSRPTSGIFRKYRCSICGAEKASFTDFKNEIFKVNPDMVPDGIKY